MKTCIDVIRVMEASTYCAPWKRYRMSVKMYLVARDLILRGEY